MIDLYQAFLKDFEYNPTTGVLTRVSTNKPVGTPNENGYLKFGYKNKFYYVHRVVWLMMTGEFPKHTIEHEDHDPSNNRWNNLHDFTQKQQQKFRQGIGYTLTRTGRYQTQCNSKYLGTFDTPEEARDAYLEEKYSD